MYHLDAGDIAAVLSLYDRKIRPVASAVPLEMIDASAMLWRLYLRGVDVGSRWAALADSWEAFAEHAYYAFNDAHAVMSFVGARRFDLAQRTIAALERKALGNDTNAMMSRDVGLPLAQALLAFGAGTTTTSIESAAADAHHCQSLRRQPCAARSSMHLTLTGSGVALG